MLFAPSDEPIDVVVLVFPESPLLTLAATLDPMRGANRVLGRTLYRWRIVSLDGLAPATTSGLRVPVDGALDPQASQDALILIAAFNVFRYADAAALRAIRAAARRSKMVGGIEAGSWVLGLAGLLDGRAATTHWEDLEEFAARFPEVEVKPDRWVVDGRVFTTGGATPALDLMLALIRARQGCEAAIDVASLYIYDEVKTASDAQPIVSLGRVGRHEPRVADAIRIMETHIDRPLSIATISMRIGTSTRSLEQMFRRTVNASPGSYYTALRLKAARRLILDTSLSMADTAERTGFSTIASLSRAFRRQFGQSPTAARKGRS